MKEALEYLGLPGQCIMVLLAIYFGIQFVGEILEFKGKTVPEFMKIRKYFARKKKEKEIFNQLAELDLKGMMDMMQGMQRLIMDFESHYSKDNIMARDCWMKKVNDNMEKNENWREEFGEMLKHNIEVTLSLSIESMRRELLNFASYVADDTKPVTREQFNRFFKVHTEYEKVIKENNIENGEVDIAYLVVKESYENHLREHTFIEDVRGYKI